MLDSLKNFISDLTGGAKHAAQFEENDYRLAAAALLIHAASADGKQSPAEREKRTRFFERLTEWMARL